MLRFGSVKKRRWYSGPRVGNWAQIIHGFFVHLFAEWRSLTSMWCFRKPSNHQLLERILETLERIERKLSTPTARTTRIAIQFGANTMAFNAVTLLVGQSTIASIVPLEADGVTVTPGAVVSNATISETDPSVTVTDNADGTVTIAGVAAGTATGTASATVTDADGTVNTFSVSFTTTVNAVTPPTGRTASIAVAFSVPA